MGRSRGVVVAGLAVLLVLAAAAPAATPPDGSLQRHDFADLPQTAAPGTVELRVARQGRRLRGFDITWLAPCDSGFEPLAQGTHASGPLSKGRFKGHGRYFSDWRQPRRHPLYGHRDRLRPRPLRRPGQGKGDLSGHRRALGRRRAAGQHLQHPADQLAGQPQARPDRQIPSPRCRAMPRLSRRVWSPRSFWSPARCWPPSTSLSDPHRRRADPDRGLLRARDRPGGQLARPRRCRAGWRSCSSTCASPAGSSGSAW